MSKLYSFRLYNDAKSSLTFVSWTASAARTSSSTLLPTGCFISTTQRRGHFSPFPMGAVNTGIPSRYYFRRFCSPNRSVTHRQSLCAVAGLTVHVAAPVKSTVALFCLMDGVGLIAPPAAQLLATTLHVARQRGVAYAALSAVEVEGRLRAAVLW